MLKDFLIRLREDELIRGSFILLIMINIFNIMNYVFHFSMGKLLGPVGYGTLAALLSFTYIFSIPSEAIQTVITKYSSIFNSKKEYGKIKYMFLRGLKKALIFSGVLYVLFIFISLYLSVFLEIDYFLFLIVGIVIFFFFLSPFTRGVLQGQKKFFSLGISFVIEGFIKVSLGIILVLIGLKVYGSILAFVLAIGISFFVTLLFISHILKFKSKKENLKNIYGYSIPYFIAFFSIILVFSMDIILARRFFNPEIAGQYSAASMLGKAIFLGGIGISKAMFPLTSENYKNNQKTKNLLLKSLSISLIVSTIVLLFYFFFPKLIINILYTNEFLDISGIIFFTGLAFAFLSFTNIIISYGLSVDKIKKSSFSLLVFVLIQVFLLSIFNRNLFEFSIALLFSNIFMFIYSLFLIIFNK